MEFIRIVFGKFREFRSTALLFGVLLYLLADRMITGVDIESSDAFWLALGVILGALAMGVSKLVDDSSPHSCKDNVIVVKDKADTE